MEWRQKVGDQFTVYLKAKLDTDLLVPYATSLRKIEPLFQPPLRYINVFFYQPFPLYHKQFSIIGIFRQTNVTIAIITHTITNNIRTNTNTRNQNTNSLNNNKISL